MNACRGITLVLLAVASALAHAQTKEVIIEQALKDGAIVVSCTCGICRNTATHEVIGSGDGGPYLVYPDGPQAQQKEEHVARLLARVEIKP